MSNRRAPQGPRHRTRSTLSLLVLLVTAFAGCMDDGGRDDRSPGTGRDLTGDPTLDDDADGQDGNGTANGTGEDDDADLGFALTSPAFTDGDAIPTRYVCTQQGGRDTNPPLVFHSVSEETVSLALIMDDPDAPAGTWDHWIVWGLDPSLGGIKEDTDPRDLDAKVGTNSAGETAYAGPCPPEGTGTHHYSFRLYALDVTLDLQEGADKEALESRMEGHVIVRAELVGTYAHTS